MSEFKFACPVCGQHITAASESSGTQIQCPTCFQKIIVPQARAADSKYIINAAQVDKPRPPQAVLQDSLPPRRRSGAPAIGGLLMLLLIATAGAGLFAFRTQLGLVKNRQPAATNDTITTANTPPGNIVWTTNLNKAKIPDAQVAGLLRGQNFTMTRAILQGGNLSLRQGKSSPPDLAISVIFPARRGEDLADKKVRVSHDQAPPLPRVVLRWKSEEGKAVSKSFAGGYSLVLEFGVPVDGRMPGKLYLALPDDEKSVLAGSFDAEIRAPAPRKKKAPPAKI